MCCAGYSDSGHISYSRKIMAIMSDELDKELGAYEQMRQSLETHHMGKWVVVHDEDLISTYDSFESAANDAVARFGRGPYLIKQVGAPSISLPASIVYAPAGGHGPNKMRV